MTNNLLRLRIWELTHRLLPEGLHQMLYKLLMCRSAMAPLLHLFTTFIPQTTRHLSRHISEGQNIAFEEYQGARFELHLFSKTFAAVCVFEWKKWNSILRRIMKFQWIFALKRALWHLLLQFKQGSGASYAKQNADYVGWAVERKRRSECVKERRTKLWVPSSQRGIHSW